MKDSGQCLEYDLIGIGIDGPSHFWAFIKDQYDPTQPWWRCDTLSGNRQVTEQEIITESAQHTPAHLIYKVKNCRGQTKNLNNHDIETLAQVLWELSR